jgi:transcriptional regulator with XRE-family HTH domain
MRQLEFLHMVASSTKRKKTDDVAGVFRIQLRELRDRKGWTQLDLAKEVGVTRTVIANYEQAVAFPPLPILVKLAQVLNVSLDTLVWGERRAEDSIDDRRLLEFFQKADRLHYRTKAVLMEVIEAILVKEEQEGRLAPEIKIKTAA